ncbi:chemotaxis protein CheW [Actinoplanes regularis]|uniref:Purine-binding chemotaxis protein CheW n=1 Tax=Actinoplanes regularis TaxID=52697 RepID=A0A238YZY0_9ACTN|nr:chemotaxis protein CheW [Actinoplanes regularis]GIE85694.1 chemotaxis protein CheW [Actinoplanes regularis]SNR76582.1 purine-binding chemotaxis protein CheW [Actinoplanes regularis]
MTDTSARVGSGRFLTFTLNGEAYAVDIFHVLEILEYRNLTVVPMMPAFIRGVINLRGRAVPVIDLAIRFDRGATTIRHRTTIIIVHLDDIGLEDGDGGSQDIGILVDSVNKVVELTEDDIEPAPSFGSGIRADYISGMARRDGDFLILLDVGQVLSISEMVSLSNAARAGGQTVEPTESPEGP